MSEIDMATKTNDNETHNKDREDDVVFGKGSLFLGWVVGTSTGWRSYVRLMLCLTGCLIAIVGAGWAENTLFLEGADIGVLEDLVLLVIYLLIPVILYTTRRVADAVNNLLNALDSLLEESSDEVTKVKTDIRSNLCMGSDKKSWRIIASVMFGLTVLFQLILPLFFPSQIRSWSLIPSNPLSFAAAIAWALFYFFGFLTPVVWFIVESGRQVFPMLYKKSKEQKLRVIPVAPDGKGGMSVVADLALALTLVPGTMVVVGLAWGLIFGVDRVLFIGFSLYLMVLSFMFFAPLWSVHTAMKIEKEQELTRLGELFRRQYDQLPNIDRLKNEDIGSEKELSQRIAMLSQIEDLYARAESMPIWPFTFETLRRFLTLTVIPAILFIIQIVTENELTEWLHSF